VNEITFSSKNALLRGQRVLYVTERAVFSLSHKGLRLIEIAPGVDIDKDILQQMDFEPVIRDRNNIKLMLEFSVNIRWDFWMTSFQLTKLFEIELNTTKIRIRPI